MAAPAAHQRNSCLNLRGKPGAAATCVSCPRTGGESRWVPAFPTGSTTAVPGSPAWAAVAVTPVARPAVSGLMGSELPRSGPAGSATVGGGLLGRAPGIWLAGAAAGNGLAGNGLAGIGPGWAGL
ncbi:hypothetical protein AHiyo8_24130 [Arthrobacter sp. Hiyo8]|nr:hypothetical protein AHiyo8_24130 [Arthrobacter sp. Hiyo8]